jgi:hypothetical protein
VSAAKKVIHGLKKAALFPIKQTIKDTKKATHFIKRYWKQIVIAAAIVFTAGIATVGIAGFSAAMGAAGGGFAGFMSAAGSTMVAGAAAIGGSVGIGSGVTASTAGGAFATAPVMSGVAAGSGLTLGTGAAAQGLGLAASTYGPTASTIAANGAYLNGVGATGSLAGNGAAPYAAAANGAGAAGASATPAATSGFNALTGAGVYTGPGSTATAAAGNAASGAASDYAYQPFTDTELKNLGVQAGSDTTKRGLLDTILDSKGSGALLSAGVTGISSVMKGKAEQDYLNQTKPLSYWGVGARGASNGGGAVTSPFAGGGTLFNQVAMTNTAPGATQPNNVISFQPSTPNGNQGLMAAGWDANLGAPVDENGNPITWN